MAFFYWYSSPCLLQLAKKNPYSFSNKCICDLSPVARHTRFSFPLHYMSSSEPFTLIPNDILGGYSTPSHLGVHYFLPIFMTSKATWVYLMQVKSETIKISKCLLLLWNPVHHLVQKIQTDNGILRRYAKK